MPVASHGIGNVSFSVLSDDEICRISVKRIHRPYSFDQVGHPVSGGLYDPALGPLDFHTSCQTCGLQFTECPGHVGHIALPVTVCNPISFPTLFKILQLICFNCGRLCVAKKSVNFLFCVFCCNIKICIFFWKLEGEYCQGIGRVERN
jgi:DNA-directed RNA polymerase I subunit RPA1